MTTKMLRLVLLPFLALTLCGCVMKSAYDAKTQEVDRLHRTLEQTEADYANLKTQYDGLEAASSSQQAQLTTLENDLLNIKQKLIEAAKPENLLKTLTETLTALQQQINALTAENSELKAALTPVMPDTEPAPTAAPLAAEVAPVAQPTAEPAVEPMQPEPVTAPVIEPTSEPGAAPIAEPAAEATEPADGAAK